MARRVTRQGEIIGGLACGCREWLGYRGVADGVPEAHRAFLPGRPRPRDGRRRIRGRPEAGAGRHERTLPANVLSLLGALPSAAAAAPTGSASTRSGGAGRDRAFARGVCFGFGAPDGPSSPGDCRSCLSSAAGCGGASRRAGAWRAGCFLSYADTDRPTAREDAFRGWFYDDGGDDAPTAALGSQCTANRTAAECARCLNESAQVVPALKEGNGLLMVHGDAVVVVGYACYLRVPLLRPTPRWEQNLFGAIGVIDVVAEVLMEVGGVLFCIKIAREFDPA
ncbi:cysteine-rich receptor-like protein kinase 15 [Panicum miliaceum]|uniref:Cysteine-rich receptor-like protein kinase 15 n=1 Tax=Panicum miliaceum TaxID=4540 RepID=A0A3L6RUD2_PANMI|nr:cysteine-rich receptor-like protein kinase 15 [Panicum miliaceum]